MQIILVTWDSGEKIAYPYEAETLLKLTISYDCSSSQIENIEIIEFLGSIYQPQDQLQAQPAVCGISMFRSNNNLNDFVEKKGGE